MPGVPALREAISAKYLQSYNVSYNSETEITVSAGGTQAIYSIITAFVKEGDDVIIIEPAYDSYAPAVRLNGGTPVYIAMKSPDYTIDWAEVQRVVTSRTKMIIVNSPHNPTGSVLKKSDYIELEKLLRDTGIILLSDEVYEHIIFDGSKHQSACLFPELRNRSFIVGSFGKTFHVTGWKMGYCLAPEALMKEYRKSHQFIVFTCNTPIQYAIAEFLSQKKNYDWVETFFQEKRDYFARQISSSRFKLVPSSGTYFQLIDFSAISNETEMDMAIRMTKEFGIATIPLSSFYHKPIENHMLRVCFAKKKETLDKAAEILCKI